MSPAPAADGRDDRRTLVRDLLILGSVVLLTRLPDLFLHFRDWDEAAMMSRAWAMTRGQLLYKDVYQIHPVLNFALFYPFFAGLPAAFFLKQTTAEDDTIFLYGLANLVVNAADEFRERERARSWPFFAEVLKGYRRVGSFGGADVYRPAPAP